MNEVEYRTHESGNLVSNTLTNCNEVENIPKT